GGSLPTTESGQSAHRWLELISQSENSLAHGRNASTRCPSPSTVFCTQMPIAVVYSSVSRPTRANHSAASSDVSPCAHMFEMSARCSPVSLRNEVNGLA